MSRCQEIFNFLTICLRKYRSLKRNGILTLTSLLSHFDLTILCKFIQNSKIFLKGWKFFRNCTIFLLFSNRDGYVLAEMSVPCKHQPVLQYFLFFSNIDDNKKFMVDRWFQILSFWLEEKNVREKKAWERTEK